MRSQREPAIPVLTRPSSDIITELQQRGPLPEHIAVIMDGNGRWARERGFRRVHGHKEGIHAVRDTTEACAELGVSHLTLYTFSTENWNRPAREVNALMQLLINALQKEAQTFHDNNIRLNAVGNVDMLPSGCQDELNALMAETASYDRMTLTLALSYSGKWDITEAVRRIAEDVQEGRISPDDVNEEIISNRLSTAGIPDPDLLIRTGGERRISNYMLWQMAYTELVFASVYWPDFRRNHLFDAIRDFQDRERRFGKVLVEG